MISRRNFVERAATLLAAWSLFPKGSRASAAPFSSCFPQGDDLQKISDLLKGKTALKWVFTGDSITQGAKHTFGFRSYPEIAAERIRWEMGRSRDLIINTAISGHTSRDVLHDFEWRIGQFQPAIVSLMIGTNDASVKKEISTAEFKKNNAELIAGIRKLGAIPILHTPNPIIIEKATGRERLPDYVSLTRETAKEKGVVLIDHWAHWTGTKEASDGKPSYLGWMNDELHPNGKGHVHMAQLFFKELSILDKNSFTGKTPQ